MHLLPTMSGFWNRTKVYIGLKVRYCSDIVLPYAGYSIDQTSWQTHSACFVFSPNSRMSTQRCCAKKHCSPSFRRTKAHSYSSVLGLSVRRLLCSFILQWTALLVPIPLLIILTTPCVLLNERLGRKPCIQLTGPGPRLNCGLHRNAATCSSTNQNREGSSKLLFEPSLVIESKIYLHVPNCNTISRTLSLSNVNSTIEYTSASTHCVTLLRQVQDAVATFHLC